MTASGAILVMMSLFVSSREIGWLAYPPLTDIKVRAWGGLLYLGPALL